MVKEFLSSTKICFKLLLSVVVLVSFSIASPPQIDPQNQFELPSTGIYYNVQAPLEVIDSDGDSIIVSSNYGNPVVTSFYIDIDNISHWQGYVQFDIVDYCGESIEENLVITAEDANHEISQLDYGTINIFGRINVLLDDHYYSWPGMSFPLAIYLDLPRVFCLGGFNFTLAWDDTIMNLVDIRPYQGIINGNYFNVIYEPYGPGTAKVEFIYDQSNPDPIPELCSIDSRVPVLLANFQTLPLEYPVNFTSPIVLYNDGDTSHTDNCVYDYSMNNLWFLDGCESVPPEGFYHALELESRNGMLHILMEGQNVATGDINVNGVRYEMADLQLGYDIVNECLFNTIYQYLTGDLEGRFQGDGEVIKSFTVGDLTFLKYEAYDQDLNWEAPSNLAADSIIIESPSFAITGEELQLPVYLSVSDTLYGFQFALAFDSTALDYLYFTGSGMFDLTTTTCSGYNHILYFNTDQPDQSDLILPGRYYLGDIHARTPEFIYDATAATIEFIDYCGFGSEGIAYSGFAYPQFYKPVLVNANFPILLYRPEYFPGDANMRAGNWPPQAVANDVTYLVNYFRGFESAPACKINGLFAAADVNGSCQVTGGDVTYLVGCFRGAATIQYCPNIPPTWLSPGDLPETPPLGWPFCE